MNNWTRVYGLPVLTFFFSHCLAFLQTSLRWRCWNRSWPGSRNTCPSWSPLWCSVTMICSARISSTTAPKVKPPKPLRYEDMGQLAGLLASGVQRQGLCFIMENPGMPYGDLNLWKRRGKGNRKVPSRKPYCKKELNHRWEGLHRQDTQAMCPDDFMSFWGHHGFPKPWEGRRIGKRRLPASYCSWECSSPGNTGVPHYTLKIGCGTSETCNKSPLSQQSGALQRECLVTMCETQNPVPSTLKTNKNKYPIQWKFELNGC